MASNIAAKPPYGVYTPLVTFFDEDESIDFSAMESHLRRMAEAGVAGLVLQGSDGEAPHLDHEERQAVIEKGPLDPGRQWVHSEAKAAGADFAPVLPPAYWAPAMTPAVVENFFSAVAEVSELPFLIYNFPTVTSGIDISSDSIVRLGRKHPGKVVGCKLTCGNLGKLQRVWTNLPEDSFAAFAGKSDFMLPGLVAGSNGVIAALANIAPKTHVKLLDLWRDGKLQEAQKLQSVLSDADVALQKVGVAGVKAIVSHFFGYGTGKGRRPLGTANVGSLSEEIMKPIETVVEMEKLQL
ncbi:hypothetical protein G7054_g265 [Neopestalotiopsis clavispora]|nr:hypothetical protein G7054_g265 [Neopestalotiopsis clavispora]